MKGERSARASFRIRVARGAPPRTLSDASDSVRFPDSAILGAMMPIAHSARSGTAVCPSSEYLSTPDVRTQEPILGLTLSTGCQHLRLGPLLQSQSPTKLNHSAPTTPTLPHRSSIVSADVEAPWRAHLVSKSRRYDFVLAFARFV